MATYTVTHTCGHVVKHRLYGKRDYRQWQLGRLAGENCWECRKAVQSAAAAEVAAEVGLPTLEGSEKQVAWAETIRVKKLLEASAHRDRMLGWINGNDQLGAEEKEAAINLANEAHDRLEQEQSAKWWIENRYTDGDHLIEDMVKLIYREQKKAAQ